jgi:hypothetical protein
LLYVHADLVGHGQAAFESLHDLSTMRDWFGALLGVPAGR